MKLNHSNSHLLLCFFISIFLSLLALSIEGIPSPIVHDEHAYILAADTYASGKLSNSIHPLSDFFESFHVLNHPVYASKYMPGQGLLLALGQIITGEAIFGVILSTALFCMALCWMLQGYFRQEMALFGALIAIVNFSFYHYWSQSYWGGSITALGAVLVFGAIIRILNKNFYASYLCGIGICLLMLTRPFEGFFFCLVPAFILVHWWIKEGIFNPIIVKYFFLPIFCMMLICISFILYNNHTLTGEYFTFAQRLYAEQTFRTPLFVWESHDSNPSFSFERMKILYENYVLPRVSLTDSILHRLLQRLTVSTEAFLGKGLIALPLFSLLLPFNKTRLWIRLILLISGTMLVMVYPTHPHYAAPLVVVSYFLFTDLLQSISDLLKSRTILIGISIFCLISISIKIESKQIYYQLSDAQSNRRKIEKKLMIEAGQDLIFVEYQNYNIHSEWVYNKADIDASPIVWARSLGIENNQKLIDYYPERKKWLLLAINNQIKLMPYNDYLKFELK